MIIHWDIILAWLLCFILVWLIGGLITKVTWTIYLRNLSLIRDKKNGANLLTKIELLSMVTFGINYLILVYMYNWWIYSYIPEYLWIKSTIGIFFIETLLIETLLIQKILKTKLLESIKIVFIGFLSRYFIFILLALFI